MNSCQGIHPYILTSRMLCVKHVQRTEKIRKCFNQMRHNSNKASVTLGNVLSFDNKKRCQQRFLSAKPVRELTKANSRVPEEAKKAAVLVPLCTVQGEPAVLFTLRSMSLDLHRGEVSFPGGKADETDEDLTHTALREAEEEMGIAASRIDVWGHLNPLPGKNLQTIVTPVIGMCGELEPHKLNFNPGEVEEVFHLTISSLCDPKHCRSTQWRSSRFKTGGSTGYTMPVYVGGPHRIWGLTAIILHQVLMAIAPGLYTFKLKHDTLTDVIKMS